MKIYAIHFYYRLAQVTLSDSDIKWWSAYSRNMTFASEYEAREWVKHQALIFQEQHGDLFKTNPDKIASDMPIYKTNATRWKIGKPIRESRLVQYTTNNDLISFQIENFSTTMGHELGKRFSECIYISVNKIKSFDTIYPDNLQKLIDVINDKEDLPPILLDDGYGILDGNHRYKAAKQLKIKEVPVVFYYNSSEGVPEEIK